MKSSFFTIYDSQWLIVTPVSSRPPVQSWLLMLTVLQIKQEPRLSMQHPYILFTTSSPVSLTHSLFCHSVHIFHVFHVFATSCAGGEIRPPLSVAGSVLCCDCLPEICINKLPVPACPRCCPGARTFAYRAVIGLPWVPSATAERVGGRQHHKWVLNWSLTAALHFMCVEARSKAGNDQREKGKR